MRPSRTPISSPQPWEQRTQADGTQRSTGPSTCWSTRTGHSAPRAYGVRSPHGFASRSMVGAAGCCPKSDTRRLLPACRGRQTADGTTPVARTKSSIIKGTMLLALIADTHIKDGSPQLPPRCLEIITGCSLIVHAGDIADLEALTALRALGPPVVAVAGNVDQPALGAALPPVAKVKAGSCTIGVIHDAGPSRGRLERMRRRFPTADAVVFGHSHIPLKEASGDGFQIFNPGSPTRRRRERRHTIGIARVDDGTISFEHVILD